MSPNIWGCHQKITLQFEKNLTNTASPAAAEWPLAKAAGVV
jgi:hypothetical protein